MVKLKINKFFILKTTLQIITISNSSLKETKAKHQYDFSLNCRSLIMWNLQRKTHTNFWEDYTYFTVSSSYTSLQFISHKGDATPASVISKSVKTKSLHKLQEYNMVCSIWNYTSKLVKRMKLAYCVPVTVQLHGDRDNVRMQT